MQDLARGRWVEQVSGVRGICGLDFPSRSWPSADDEGEQKKIREKYEK